MCERWDPQSIIWRNSDLPKFTNAGKICKTLRVQPRKNSKAICSGCYDSQSSARRFDFIPIWGIPVIFIYTMRRVCCQECGVKVEEVPWAKGKSSLTQTYMQFLANWCKSLSLIAKQPKDSIRAGIKIIQFC